MRQRSANVSNDRYLLIRLLLPADAAVSAQRLDREPSAATSSLPLMISPPSSVRLTLLLAAADRFHFRRTVQGDARRLAQQTKQPLADIVEFNHLPQRRQAVIGRRQVHKTSVTTVADVDPLDGRRSFSQGLPDTNARQLLAVPAARAIARSSKPGWRDECGSCASIRWTGRAPPVKREMASAERRAGHPAADNQHAHDWRAAAISASISSAFFTTLAVRFSLPSSVMTMSSSIRMPMPR